MSLEEIKGLIESNKDNEDVKVYLQGLNSITVEGVQKFLGENEDAKKWLDSEKDKHFNKSFNTWKQNNWEKELETEIKKRFPEKDQKDIELEKIKSQLAQMEAEKTKETLKNKALSIVSEKKLPTKLVDYFLGTDEESTMSNLSVLEEVFNSYIQSQVEERLKGNSHTPPAGGEGKGFTLEQIQNMSPDEINKNWEEIRKVMQRP